MVDLRVVFRVEGLPWRIALAVAPTLTAASHSVPWWPFYWDVDNDGIAEAADSAPTFQKLGNLWSAQKESRLDSALGTWRNNTDFNPAKAATSVNSVRIDGAVPYCVGSWSPSTVALNCVA